MSVAKEAAADGSCVISSVVRPALAVASVASSARAVAAVGHRTSRTVDRRHRSRRHPARPRPGQHHRAQPRAGSLAAGAGRANHRADSRLAAAIRARTADLMHAADGRHVPGRWPHAQRLSGLARGEVDVVHARTGLDADAARLDVEHAAHLRHVEHDAALERHALAVVAGAARAHRERQLPLRCDGRGLPHVVFGADLDDEVGHAARELRREDGAVPVEVLRQLLALRRRGDEVEAAQVGAHGIPVDGRHDGPSVHGASRFHANDRERSETRPRTR